MKQNREELKMEGRKNIIIGLFTMAAFMVYGFLLIYLRDFAPNASEWAASYGNGKHFEARLAHVHGNLFAFLNIMLGYLLFKLDINPKQRKIVSWLGVLGLLMPIGIVLELLLSASPIFVLLGAISMTLGIFLLGYFLIKSKKVVI
jgi:hypothetical protein